MIKKGASLSLLDTKRLSNGSYYLIDIVILLQGYKANTILELI